MMKEGDHWELYIPSGDLTYCVLDLTPCESLCFCGRARSTAYSLCRSPLVPNSVHAVRFGRATKA